MACSLEEEGQSRALCKRGRGSEQPVDELSPADLVSGQISGGSGLSRSSHSGALQPQPQAGLLAAMRVSRNTCWPVRAAWVALSGAHHLAWWHGQHVASCLLHIEIIGSQRAHCYRRKAVQGRVSCPWRCPAPRRTPGLASGAGGWRRRSCRPAAAALAPCRKMRWQEAGGQASRVSMP